MVQQGRHLDVETVQLIDGTTHVCSIERWQPTGQRHQHDTVSRMLGVQLVYGLSVLLHNHIYLSTQWYYANCNTMKRGNVHKWLFGFGALDFFFFLSCFFFFFSGVKEIRKKWSVSAKKKKNDVSAKHFSCLSLCIEWKYSSPPSLHHLFNAYIARCLSQPTWGIAHNQPKKEHPSVSWKSVQYYLLRQLSNLLWSRVSIRISVMLYRLVVILFWVVNNGNGGSYSQR